MRYWRIVAGHEGAKSIILGDWLRKEYIAIGFEDDPEHIMNIRFGQMEKGDKIVVVTEGYVYAVGEISSDVYEKDEERLYVTRRNVEWYLVCRVSYRNFPKRLRNKLQNRQTLLEMSEDEWQTLMLCLK